MTETTYRLPDFELEIEGETYQGQTATVDRFSLGPEDHGIWTADISFSGEGWGQSLGAYGLDAWNEAARQRVGTIFGMEFIMAAVKILGSPEQAKGKRVVVFRQESYGTILGFARLEDSGKIGEPFFPKVLAAKCKDS